jgi:25S rRNA (adenine2142-N1)-methyltransferase
MERPLSIFDDDLFDIISLSLVVNYVPDAAGRGEMLRRTRDFMNTSNLERPSLLFFVLPASCVTNSRYMNENHLNKIMASLDFELLEQKLSPKLYYSLWALSIESLGQDIALPKVEVNPGRTRNNFCIVLS